MATRSITTFSLSFGLVFENGKFILFTAHEPKALEAGSQQTIDIVAFIPGHAVDPIYYDKAYFVGMPGIESAGRLGSRPPSLRAVRSPAG